MRSARWSGFGLRCFMQRRPGGRSRARALAVIGHDASGLADGATRLAKNNAESSSAALVCPMDSTERDEERQRVPEMRRSSRIQRQSNPALGLIELRKH